MEKRNYWRKVYNDKSNTNKGNHQANVGRTLNGKPIDDTTWNKTVEYISSLLEIDDSQTILELCCGNGMLLGPLSRKCSKAYGIDFSSELIDQLKLVHGDDIITSVADVMEVEMVKGTLDVVILYFSIQHFTEAETIYLTARTLDWLKPGGRLYIGDIPDQGKLWDYLEKPAYKKDYLERILTHTPKIGQWFQRGFFSAFQDYFEQVEVQVLDQPAFMINSEVRFDVLIKKR